MSIIQDALKRKDAPPAAATAGPPPPPAPAAPPPRPESFPPPPLPSEPPRKGVSPALIVLLAVVVLGAGGFALHRSGLLGRFTSGTSAPDAPGEPPPASPPPADGSAAGGGGPAPAPATPATPPAAATNAPMDTPDEPGEPVEAPPPRGPATAASNAPPVAPAKPAVVRWPAFTVKGIIAGRTGTGSVIVNKSLVDIGQTTAEGLRVVRLAEDGVVLEYKGQERLFRVGTGSP